MGKFIEKTDKQERDFYYSRMTKLAKLALPLSLV